MKKYARIILVMVLVNAVFVGVTACGGTTTNSVTVSGSSAQVTMKNLSFDPGDLTIDKGATVTWSNQDSTGHTVVAADGSFNSGGIINPGQNYGYTFNQTGTFDYACTIHPTMKGKITVK